MWRLFSVRIAWVSNASRPLACEPDRLQHGTMNDRWCKGESMHRTVYHASPTTPTSLSLPRAIVRNHLHQQSSRVGHPIGDGSYRRNVHQDC